MGTGGAATSEPIDTIDADYYPPEDEYYPPDDEDLIDLTCEQQDVTNCDALIAAGVGVDLATCQSCQGASCGADAGSPCGEFPCIDGVVVIRGCCSDRDCRGLASFCGMYTGPHYLCVTDDAM